MGEQSGQVVYIVRFHGCHSALGTLTCSSKIDRPPFPCLYFETASSDIPLAIPLTMMTGGLCTSPACVHVASDILNTLAANYTEIDPCTDFDKCMFGACHVINLKIDTKSQQMCVATGLSGTTSHLVKSPLM